MSVRGTKISIPYDLNFEVCLMYHYMLRCNSKVIEAEYIGRNRYHFWLKTGNNGYHASVALYA